LTEGTKETKRRSNVSARGRRRRKQLLSSGILSTATSTISTAKKQQNHREKEEHREKQKKKRVLVGETICGGFETLGGDKTHCFISRTKAYRSKIKHKSLVHALSLSF
jgi:hypothetical protein